jgi:branched-chain amino acid transport system substrate-binding protein
MTRIFLLVVTGVLLLFVSCSPADIRIGAFLPLTGPTSAYGISAANAMKLAVDEVNQSGDFIGFDLEIEDDQSKTENVANVVNHLITDRKVQALLAEPVSTRAMVAAPIAQQNQIVMISSSSVKPELTMQGNYIFRACFVSSTEGDAIAEFARERLKAKTVAIILDPKNDYAVVLANFFAESFRKRGGTLISQQRYEANATDLKEQIAAIKTAAPDVIFAPGFYTTAPLIAREVKRAGIKSPLIGSDGWDSPELLKNGSDVFEGVYFANHFWIGSDDLHVQHFVDSYRARYKVDPDAGAATAYDATRMLIDAFRDAKSRDSADVRNTLAATKNFIGVTGMITLDENRNAQVPVYILRIEGGKFTLQQ